MQRVLRRARAGLRRLSPCEVAPALAQGAVLVDIRPEGQRRREGGLAGAVVICRNVLEWRCDPTSPWRDARVSDPSRRLIVICREGYQSSLAAAALQELGHPQATDVIGGTVAWRAGGLAMGSVNVGPPTTGVPYVTTVETLATPSSVA